MWRLRSGPPDAGGLKVWNLAGFTSSRTTAEHQRACLLEGTPRRALSVWLAFYIFAEQCMYSFCRVTSVADKPLATVFSLELLNDGPHRFPSWILAFIFLVLPHDVLFVQRSRCPRRSAALYGRPSLVGRQHAENTPASDASTVNGQHRRMRDTKHVGTLVYAERV